MIERCTYRLFLCLLIFAFSCNNEEDISQDTPLAVSLITSADEIEVGSQLIISLNVNNADSLFALSFALNYDPDLFDVDSTADIVNTGNLFVDPFVVQIPEFLTTGEVSVALAEWGLIRHTVSGIACSIILSATNTGTGSIYISSLDMIKKSNDEPEIDGCCPIIIEPVEVTVFE